MEPCRIKIKNKTYRTKISETLEDAVVPASIVLNNFLDQRWVISSKKKSRLLKKTVKSLKASDSTPFVLGALFVVFLNSIRVDRNKTHQGVDCTFYMAVLAALICV